MEALIHTRFASVFAVLRRDEQGTEVTKGGRDEVFRASEGISEMKPRQSLAAEPRRITG